MKNKAKEFQSELFDYDEVYEESVKHNDFWNSVFGFACFTISLTCIGMPNPGKAAIFSLGIIVPLLVMGGKNFPPTIQAMRDLYKETKDEHVRAALNYLEKEFVGLKTFFTKNMLFWYGFFMYLGVLFSPEFTMYMKAI
jgi:hypothetical protein